MPVLNSYLTFDDKCEEAFNFYKSVFGGEFATTMRFKDAPGEHQQKGEENKIMHIALPVKGGAVLMGSDSPQKFGGVKVGTNLAISITADSEDEAHKLFDGLSAGGQVTVPLDKAFWGSLFGMFTDKYGVQWMMSYDYNR